MITVAGSSFDISTIMDEYPSESVESQLLTSMAQSAERYRYDSLDELKFELRLRREIVDAAYALDKSRFSFATFHKSRCNPKYWERMPNGGFKLKSGVSPSEAIEDIFTYGVAYATECATAMMIVYYKALLNVFGRRFFDERFTSIYLMNWHITDPLLKAVGIPRRTKDFLLGDRAYFSNPDVDPKTPEWQGENVIVLPGGFYYGHGIGITSAEEIMRVLNDNRKRGATQPSYMRDTVGRPDFDMLAALYARSAAQSGPLVWNSFPPAIRAGSMA